MKKNKGITLIALVITIIILLILAGVALSIVFNGGIVDKSQKATEKVKMDSFKEEVSLAMLDRKIERNGTLEESLNASISGNKIVEKSELSDDICYVTRNGDTITVYENGDVVEGRVSVWTGESDVPEIKNENGKFNWYIYTADELKFLADYVNNARQLNDSLTAKLSSRNYSASDVVMDENTTVFLMNNLDLGARPGNGATIDDQWAVNSSKIWEPIGADNDTKKMIATFEGNNYIISGVYVNKDGNFAGIFGNSNTINKLTVKNSYIKGEIGVGGIVGALREGKINSCHNINTIVKGNGAIVAGIVGQAEGIISDCSNNGEITGLSGQVSGIVANALPSSTITGCTNSGKVTGIGSSVGGIVGNAQNSCIITGCTNSGNISGQSINIGGVIGRTLASCMVTGCTNNGEISSTGLQLSTANSQFAGIIGSATTTSISECINNGNISGYANIGGITGFVNSSTTVTKCTNNGSITASQVQCGGIAGASNSGSITECTNNGITVANVGYSGGIIGFISSSTTISKCTNTGNVESGKTAGGIVGELNGEVDKCANFGNVKSRDGVGGIVAHVAASNSAKVTNCYNTGTVTLEKLETSANSCGGIFGWVSNTSTSVEIKNNYNIGKVIGSDDVGGVIGHVTSVALDKFDISNNYSLRGCVELKDINNPETVISETELTVLDDEVMEAENMKTDSFVTTLGSDNWTRDAGKNNGYPILK